MKKTSILVIVDYQNDFVTGSLGFERAKQLDRGIRQKIEEYIEKSRVGENAHIIFTFDTHDKEYLDTQEGHKLPISHCVQGTDGWKLYGKVGEMHNIMNDNHFEFVHDIYKNTFGSLELADLLKSLARSGGMERAVEIEFTGVVTNICVISNAIIAKSALPEAEITIHPSLCASNNEDLHLKALDVLRELQFNIKTN